MIIVLSAFLFHRLDCAGQRSCHIKQCLCSEIYSLNVMYIIKADRRKKTKKNPATKRDKHCHFHLACKTGYLLFGKAIV